MEETTALRMVYGALEELKITNLSHLMYFYKTIYNVAPEKRLNLSVLESFLFGSVETRQERKVFLILTGLFKVHKLDQINNLRLSRKTQLPELFGCIQEWGEAISKRQQVENLQLQIKLLHTSIGKNASWNQLQSI